jgi:hypothetical protein
MTRAGLSRMAKELAGLEGESSDHLRASLRRSGAVSEDDIERVKRLASVVPHPTIELLEVLRKRFAPDVSDAVVLHLLPHAGGPLTPVVRLSDEEVQRCLAAMRLETPHLEAAVRRAVVEVLSDSQPTAGSTAHQRWQLAIALQQLQLADIDKSDASEALATIRTLGDGPNRGAPCAGKRGARSPARCGAGRAPRRRLAAAGCGRRRTPAPAMGLAGAA